MGAGRSNFIKVVCLSLVSGMVLAGASIALTFSPTRNGLPNIELSINFAFRLSRAVMKSRLKFGMNLGSETARSMLRE